MSEVPAVGFGRLQHRILRILWARGPLPARDVTDALNAEAEEGVVAHSTVQTLLRKMEAKGAVTHDVVERSFHYRAATAQEPALRSVVQEFVNRVFGGSAAELMAHLVREERVPAEELARIRALAEKRRTEEGQ